MPSALLSDGLNGCPCHLAISWLLNKRDEPKILEIGSTLKLQMKILGEVFAGTVSGVTHFGLFVTLDGLNVDGLVHVTELGNDYFHFDPIRHAMNGERTGKSFRLADRITVKVARVDLEATKIDFVLVEGEAGAAAQVRKARASKSK